MEIHKGKPGTHPWKGMQGGDGAVLLKSQGGVEGAAAGDSEAGAAGVASPGE